MLLSAILMGMLALGFTTSAEASPHHHNPHGSFHSVHHPTIHQPQRDHFRKPHVPSPHVKTPRHDRFQPHHITRPSHSSNHRHW